MRSRREQRIAVDESSEPKAKNLNNSQIGMLGVHLVAAELIRRGFVVSPTSRGAFGADLLVTDVHCQKAWSVQVKTTQNKAKYFNVAGKAELLKSKSHVYVFVSFEKDEPQFLVVRSDIVARHVRRQPDRPDGWPVFDRKNAGKKQWSTFGNSHRLTLPVKPGSTRTLRKRASPPAILS
jgi:hypothetical protein